MSFNQNWLFRAAELELTALDSEFLPVTLPHTNQLYPTRFVDNATYQFVSTYRKRFTLPESAAGQQVFLDFDGAMLKSTVYLNGVLLGEHSGGYTPFSFELTPHLVAEENLLTVYVDATESAHIPPYGGLVDYLTFGGLYRDVHLRIVDPCHITQAFVRPSDVLTTPSLTCDIQLSKVLAELSVEISLQDAHGTPIAQQTHAVTQEKTTLTLHNLSNIALWTLENPVLYSLKIQLRHADTPLDCQNVRFGFRSAEFRTEGGFFLNGEPLKLFGLNRHQTYPYLGAAASKRLQHMDADILKYELGCNIVRTSHYAQSPHFLNRCDEIGLLVFEELAGWQHIGDQAWQDFATADLQAMIERDRHHPSIILWGVRINESPDCETFYTRTNALARQLDPTRQTAGVRNFIQSQFLEDVFTLNDFPEGIQDPLVSPHLITEFAGHMFPTKIWDHEERRIEQALIHAEKHNLQIGHAGISGAIGWCAFDYHTHKEFGSGDRICHHGVMDIHRLPKFAAYFYRSQKSPQDEIVLQAATNWTMGDRSGGGNNPLVIFTNCEAVEVWIGDEAQGVYYPDHVTYPNLKYAPVIVRWPEPYNPWGTSFEDLILKGYIGQTVVAEQRIASDHLPQALQLTAYAVALDADGADTTRVTVRVVDKYGNILPYQMNMVEFSLEGDAELIGENPLVLAGGQAAFYIKAGHTAGTVNLIARTQGLPSTTLTLQIGL